MNLQTTKRLNNGVEIPMLGLGVFRMEGEETVSAVRWALDAGYTHIDTARAYGNEQQVGRAIAQSGIAREKLFVTTKLFNNDIRAGRAREAFEESLASLGLEYVDLYLIHWPATGFEAAWKAMEQLYAQKKIRAIGVSNFHPHHLSSLLKDAQITPAVNQFEMHPHLTQQPLRAHCAELGIACESWSPLGGIKGTVLTDPVITAIGEKYKKSAAQVILRWNLQHDVIVIPKSSKQGRIEENTRLFDFALTPEEMGKIDALNRDARVGSDPDNFNF